MSRSGYHGDYDGDDDLAVGRWAGQVASAIRGKRGQAFLRELIDALDAIPNKQLISNELRRTEVEVDGQGFGQVRNEVCALGAVGHRRDMKLEELDPEDPDELAGAFGIAHQLVREIEYMNDEFEDTPERRWQRVREWAVKHLKVSVTA